MNFRSRARNYAYYVRRSVLVKILNYYKFNTNDRNAIVNAYNKLQKARYVNRNGPNAYNNAKTATSEFLTTVLKVYEKAENRPRTSVTNGMRNGMWGTLVYWFPGMAVRLLQRRVSRHFTKPRNVPPNNLN